MREVTSNVYIEDRKEDVSTITGEIHAINCTGSELKSISGNILISDSTYKRVSTLSGDIDIHSSEIEEIESLSGHISISNSKIKRIVSMGTVTAMNCTVDEIICERLGRVDGSTIQKITVNTNHEIVKGKIEKETNEIYLHSTSNVEEINYDRNIISPYQMKTNGTLTIRNF